jgi:hypothetical protein
VMAHSWVVASMTSRREARTSGVLAQRSITVLMYPKHETGPAGGRAFMIDASKSACSAADPRQAATSPGSTSGRQARRTHGGRYISSHSRTSSGPLTNSQMSPSVPFTSTIS